jgi:hypothetical protein
MPLSLVFLAPQVAEAFPAFARTYQVPCSTCHVVITRRNEFGDAFRKNGYRWPGDPAHDFNAKKPAPIEMLGVSFLDGLLPTSWPFSAIISFSGGHETHPDSDENFRLGSPSVGLLFGTTLNEHLSVMGIWAPGSSPSEFVLQATRLFDRPELNIRAGKIEATTTLFKNSEQLADSYLLTSTSKNGLSLGSSKLGAELNGIVYDQFFYALGTVKSNTQNGDQFNSYYHLSTRLGGTNFSGEEPDIDFDDPSFIDDISFMLGHWGYFGSMAGAGGVSVSQVRRVGFDMKLSIPEWSLWAGVMLGQDTDLSGKIAGNDGEPEYVKERHITAFTELYYSINSWLKSSYIYQWQDSSRSKTKITQRHSVGFFFLALENMRIALTYNFENSEAADAKLLGSGATYLGTGKLEIRLGL